MYGAKYYALMRGDPGFFKSIGKFVGGVVKTLAPIGIGIATGGIGGIAAKGILGIAAKTAVGKMVGKVAGGAVGRVISRVMPGAGTVVGAGAGSVAIQKFGTPMLAGPVLKMNAARALALGGAAVGGTIAASQLGGLVGGGRRKYRRMNPLNPKAANRAIRRIKAVRKMVRSIESQLPKRAAPRGVAPRRRRAA